MELGPDFRHYESFVAVAEECSFRKAAEKLHISQPALSAQIKQLEHWIGKRLVIRGRIASVLTEPGRNLLIHARYLLHLRSHSKKASTRKHSATEWPLRLGYSPFINHILIDEALTAYKEIVPEGRINSSSDCSAHLIEMLEDGRLDAATLQSFLARGQNHSSTESPTRHLYMLDESSLASTKQMRSFLGRLGPEDRVLVIGDTRQHQGVDAGRPFQQMQEAGMLTSKLDKIMRQKDTELLKAVQHLANGETVQGIALLAEQGRVTEIPNGRDRIAAIAKDYAAQPEDTIIVSPDNRSRQQINEAVRVELRRNGALAEDGEVFRTLSHRSDMTGADRKWAARYEPGNVLQYTTGSKSEGIDCDSFATVRSIDTRKNLLTVDLENSSSVTYDPRRLQGVHVFREVEREFAVGDKIQVTAPNKDLGLANRDLGTITAMRDGEVVVRMDGKEERSRKFDPREFRQFDHGYAVTSHSSQGLTAGRVLAHIHPDSSRGVINERLAYVAISRASDDARIYTNNEETLGETLASHTSKTAALDAPCVDLKQTGREPASTVRGNHVITSSKRPEIDLEGFGLGL